MNKASLSRLRLAHLPTPIEPLPRLSAMLGVELSIKRDDQTGLALGGNKVRKLEFLLAEAQTLGAQTLITTGAAQSNHCRQTAGAAAKQGFACILVLAGHPPSQTTGNVLLDNLLGAEIVWSGDREVGQVFQETFKQAQQDGRQPYMVPYGGSSPVGAAAYAAAIGELMEQDVPVDRIAFASSSGGTQAGMVVGARMHAFPGRITGISVDKPAASLCETVATLANETASLLGEDLNLAPSQIEVKDAYLGGGYGVVGNLERNAIHLWASQEGLLLDPVYTGRAAGGLMDMIQKGEIDSGERVLFWHTGGTPSLFAYTDQLR
ncbi:MAG TPA: D-cysteine desulfhydrase family protein [Anaerolineae bacterium]|nr:D-cysteine desulfhydrase family protein [Anaerolineae bacterium]